MRRILNSLFLCFFIFSFEAEARTKEERQAAKAAREAKEPPFPEGLKQYPEVKPAPPVAVDMELVLSRQQIANAASVIDEHIANGLAKAQVKANPAASEEALLRRLYLDIIGRIPSDDEADRFFSSRDPDKVADLIDELLVSDGYRSHQFTWMGDMLRHKSEGARRGDFALYDRWLKDQLKMNRPWNEVVYEMLTAKGSLATSGPAGYLMRDPGMPLDNLSNTLTIFLGANVSCAQCHDHPLAQWTQQEFYEMAAFFGSSEVSARDPRKISKNLATNALSKQDLIKVVAQNMASITELGAQTLVYPEDYAYDHAEPGDPVVPMLLSWGGDDFKGAAYQIDTDDPTELRNSFASWMTHPENPRFATTIANRLWKKNFGIAVQEPVEDMDDPRLASNPALLAFLGQIVVAAKFDLREYQRVLYHTKAYQAEASVTPAIGDIDDYPFPGPVLRRMTAEQAWDSIQTLIAGTKIDSYETDYSHYVSKFAFPFDDFSEEEIYNTALAMKASGYLKKKERQRGLDLRASALPQPERPDHFLRMFGQSSRELIDDGSLEGNIPQTLVLMNGEIQEMVSARDARLTRKAKSLDSMDEQVEFLYLSFFSRKPTEKESDRIKQAMEEGTSVPDLAWVLFNTPEFLFVQ